jgi:oxygen-dependent protoporphyrinogen oxidase
MGKSFLEYAIDPFILGIYSGDPARLVTQYAFPKLYRLEQDYGSFIGGAFKKAREPKSDREKKATKSIFSVEGGLSNLIQALEKNIGSENIRLNCRDLQFGYDKDTFTVNLSDQFFTHAISTSGAYELESLFPFIPKSEVNTINQMIYSRVVQVALGFKKWKGIPLNAFGGLVPSVEQRRILGVLFLSSFLKDKAPDGGALLSVFLGGIRQPGMIELSDQEINQVTKEELTDMFKLKSFEPDLIKIFRYKHAIPQYGVESEKKLETIFGLEKKYPGLKLAGNIREGIGIADRIYQGRNLASEIINSMA